jgi:hypothetical protein
MIRTVLILCGLCVLCVKSEAAVDAERLASAIRPVEDWHGRDGAAGERGPYQITRAVWSMHMPGTPFAAARQEGPGRACALKHIAWLARELKAAGWPDNAHTIALAYNAGLTAVLEARAPQSSYDYALRVENIYHVSQPLLGAAMAPRIPSVRTTDERRFVLSAALFRVCWPSTDYRANRPVFLIP